MNCTCVNSCFYQFIYHILSNMFIHSSFSLFLFSREYIVLFLFFTLPMGNMLDNFFYVFNVRRVNKVHKLN